jgi:hypothetical protein
MQERLVSQRSYGDPTAVDAASLEMHTLDEIEAVVQVVSG